MADSIPFEPTLDVANSSDGTNHADSTRLSVSRRRFLRGAALTGGVLAGSGLVLPTAEAGVGAGIPALVRRGRPELTHGIQSGDVTSHSATLWGRADRAALMEVELSRTPSFRRSWRSRPMWMTERTDLTAKTVVRGLPSGSDLWFRLTPVDGRDYRRRGEPLTGHFRTPSRRPDDVSFVWSGDLGGQGWGINTDIGGYRIFDAMRRLNPDFFICNGDNIYADGPIPATMPLPDGSTWHNVTTPEKSEVAQTLDGYRGAYKYNLMDEAIRRFYGDVAQIQQWDDHETYNNWYPGEILDDPAYQEKRVDVLAGYSSQAFHEYTPMSPAHGRDGRIYRVQHHGPLLDVFVLDMRTFRNANSKNDQGADPVGLFGEEQLGWLKRELKKSRATWKIISNDMPLGIVVGDGDNYEASSQGDPGGPLGRELQVAELLSWLKREQIRNVVWLTTDVHYTAAHYFDPDKAAYDDFDPFWQFVSGPLNAGSFPASPIDATFGTTQVFVKSPTVANTSPATEYQFFGQVGIDGESRELTVNLRDNSGASLWSTTLEPQRR